MCLLLLMRMSTNNVKSNTLYMDSLSTFLLKETVHIALQGLWHRLWESIKNGLCIPSNQSPVQLYPCIKYIHIYIYLGCFNGKFSKILELGMEMQQTKKKLQDIGMENTK